LEIFLEKKIVSSSIGPNQLTTNEIMSQYTSFYEINTGEASIKKAFEYVKVHRKSLAMSIVYLVFPVLALNAILYFFLIMQNFFNVSSLGSTAVFQQMLLSYLGMMVVGFFSFAMLLSVVFLHIKISSEKGFYTPLTVQDVWLRFKIEAKRVLVNYFIMALFHSFVFWVGVLLLFLAMFAVVAFFIATHIFVLNVIGFILSVFIVLFFGSYMMGVFSLNAFMVVFEKENAIHLFGKALKMVGKNAKNFWQTIWTSIVGVLSIYMFYSLVMVPVGVIMSLNQTFLQLGDYSQILTIISVVSLVGMFVSPFLISLSLTLSGFLYFTLEENAYHKSLYERINRIGETEEKDALYDFS